MSIDLKELAEELDELREEFDLGPEGKERMEALATLEQELGGDLHIASRNVTLIHENDFKKYAQDYARDMGLKTDGWPYDSINWEEAADDLKPDFTSVDFDGESYYTRDV